MQWKQPQLAANITLIRIKSLALWLYATYSILYHVSDNNIVDKQG